eukprot:Skav208764  [mRNA]  locus=scaffold4352:142767:146454:- [translate_table: standard]
MEWELYTTSTAIGKCRLDAVGHLKPCDDRHAPIRLYRSYGEWFEAGLQALLAQPAFLRSRFWPYGQSVTHLHKTVDKKNQYKLDDRTVPSVRPYVPPRETSLPDLRAYRGGDCKIWKESRSVAVGKVGKIQRQWQHERTWIHWGVQNATVVSVKTCEMELERFTTFRPKVLFAMDNFAAKHGAWQQHLGKEKKARQKGTLLYYGKKGGAQILAPKAPPAPTVDDVTKVAFVSLLIHHGRGTVLLLCRKFCRPSSQRSRRPLGSLSTGLLLLETYLHGKKCDKTKQSHGQSHGQSHRQSHGQCSGFTVSL